MKLKIEVWLEKQRFSDIVNNIFDESIVCYKAEAYRASMVLAYIGFLTILKERMLQSSAPTGISPALWSSIISEIQDDDKWDTKIRDETQRKNPAPIFILSDDLRHQIIYWKNRRNDCAHFKPTEIKHYHIESFWGFLEDNVSKLVVNGSFAALKNKIQIHFDISRTPYGQDVSPLVKEIETAITPSELSTFFYDIHSIFASFSSPNNEEELRFYNEIFKQSTISVKGALANFIKGDSILLMDFLRYKPDKVAELNLDAVTVRNLWFTTLFTTYQNDFSIYVALINNHLIPPAQYQEANETVLERLTWPCKPNNAFERKILEDIGFYDLFTKRLIDEGQLRQWDWSNPKSSFIVDYFEYNPFTVETVRLISNAFNSAYNPHDVRDALNKMFQEIPTKKAEFISLATSNSITVPSHLRSLH